MTTDITAERIATLNEVLDIIDGHRNVPNVVREAILDLLETAEDARGWPLRPTSSKSPAS